MRDFLKRAPEPSRTQLPKDPDQSEVPKSDSESIFMGYDSDLESDDKLLDDDEDSVDDQESTANECDRDGEPPVKRIRRRLNEPVVVTWLKKCERRTKKWKQALHDIEKLLQSQKTQFQAGDNSLQSYRA